LGSVDARFGSGVSLVGEIVTGIVAGSFALIADAGHLMLALVGIWTVYGAIRRLVSPYRRREPLRR
jgi:Co/Zn/Cd efflux system component